MILGCFIGSVVFSPLSFFATCLFVSIFLISSTLLKLVNMKVFARMMISSYLGDIIGRYIFEIMIKDELSFFPFIFSIVSIVLSFLMIKIVENLINEERRQYPYQIVFFILIIVSVSLMGIDFVIFNVSTLFIVLSIFFLFCIGIIDFSIYFSLLFVNLILLFILKDVSYIEMISLFLPCVITNQFLH